MERKYIIPLRKEWLKSPIYKRTPRAVRAVKEFLKKHMKVEDVRLGRNLNMALWTNGNRNPPHKIEVNVKKFETKDELFVRAELVGKEFEEEKEKKEAKEKSKLAQKLEDLAGKKDTKVSAKRGKEKTETKAEEHKKEEEKVKDEVLKKEAPKQEEVKAEQKDSDKEADVKAGKENLVKRDDKKEMIKK